MVLLSKWQNRPNLHLGLSEGGSRKVLQVYEESLDNVMNDDKFKIDISDVEDHFED